MLPKKRNPFCASPSTQRDAITSCFYDPPYASSTYESLNNNKNNNESIKDENFNISDNVISFELKKDNVNMMLMLHLCFSDRFQLLLDSK